MRREEEWGDFQGATPSQGARLLIADDHALVREGLRTMLSGEDGLEVIAEANDGQQALDVCRELKPDLVLMDVRMPVMDGLEATKRIKDEMPKTSVMMVTMHENPDYLFEAVKAGAAGYVLKDASGERLLSAVRRTLEGESPLNQELAMQLLVRLSRESGGSSEERTGGGSGERSGRASPRPSGATPEEGPREEGESLASHPQATVPEATHLGTSGRVERVWAVERDGADRELDAEGDRGVEAAQSGADQPPDRQEPDGQPRDRQDPRPAHNLQAWSVGQDPGRRPRHRVRDTLADWGRADPSQSALVSISARRLWRLVSHQRLAISFQQE